MDPWNYSQRHTRNFSCFLGNQSYSEPPNYRAKSLSLCVLWCVSHSGFKNLSKFKEPTTGNMMPWAQQGLRLLWVAMPAKGRVWRGVSAGASAFSASLSADNYNLSVIPWVVSFSGSDPQASALTCVQETPGSRLPFWPKPSFQPQCSPWCPCSCLGHGPCSGRLGHCRANGSVSLPASTPVSVLSKFRLGKLPWFLSWVSWGVETNPGWQRKRPIFCFRKWFVKWVLFGFDFQLLIHNMWPH